MDEPPGPPNELAESGQPVAPSDPNAKAGPSGFGPQAFLPLGRHLAYRIDFENEPRATAPAQFVVVTDQLSDRLDWETFELTEVGFGDILIVAPVGRTSYRTNVPVTLSGADLEVQIDIALDRANGRITARFATVDPLTELPPDVLTGFLPPEDGTGRGQGHISYVIRTKPVLDTGTEIRNIARIQFDFGVTIATNQRDPHDPAQGTDPNLEALVTIDAGPPSSWVLPLPAETAANPFVVSWSGQDDAGGSGIAGYDIYVSDNGAAWVVWQDDVTITSASFTGQVGHTYAFFSTARDPLGYEEGPPATADAVTTVVLELPAEVAIEQTGTSIALSWPESATGCVLETSDVLTPGSVWTEVTEAPVLSGGRYTITIEPVDSNRFFRLTRK
jgi:hypothetical protein